ncbi:MAG: alpha/beta hydrolase [Acidimicrobiia bacterium]
MTHRNSSQGGAGPTRIALRHKLLQGLAVTERRVEVAGVSTAYIQGGVGRPLVLLHGQGGSGLAWLPVLPRFLESHQVIAPDLPGLGESVVRAGEIGPELAVSWLGGLIDETCDQPPTVVGFSLGGAFAARLAVARPGKCRLVVLADSGGLAPFRPDPTIIPALIRLNVRPSPANLARFFSKTLVDFERFRDSIGDKWQAFQAYGLERNSNPEVKSANRELLRRLGTPQIPTEELRGIEDPVALIWGDRDRIMRVGIARAAHEAFGWPLYVIENSGHTTKWDRPDAFVDAVESAIKEAV